MLSRVLQLKKWNIAINKTLSWGAVFNSTIQWYALTSQTIDSTTQQNATSFCGHFFAWNGEMFMRIKWQLLPAVAASMLCLLGEVGGRAVLQIEPSGPAWVGVWYRWQDVCSEPGQHVSPDAQCVTWHSILRRNPPCRQHVRHAVVHRHHNTNSNNAGLMLHSILLHNSLNDGDRTIGSCTN